MRVRIAAASVCALVLVALAALLGYWQLQAWQDKRAAEARDLTSVPAMPMVRVLGPDEPFPADAVGQPVDVTGRWLPEGRFWVSGRAEGTESEGGREGYWFVVPMTVSGASAEGTDERAVPVVLGWSPTATGEAPSGPAAVSGWLQPPEGTGAVDDDPGDDVVPQLRVADAIQRVDLDLYGAYVVSRDPLGGLDTAASLDALPEIGSFTAARNFFYAVEWWFFGGFAAFIWWRFVRDELAAGVPTGATSARDR